jgi:transposase
MSQLAARLRPPRRSVLTEASCNKTGVGFSSAFLQAINSKYHLTWFKEGQNYIYMIRRPSKPDPKLAALKRSGTANAHAKDIQDPAFIDSEFFDPRDLIQVRYEMLRRVRTEGRSVTEATKLFGVSRPTFYKLRKDFDRGGLVGLLPVKRGPHGPRKITPEVMRFIEEAAAGSRASELTRLVGEIARRFSVVVHPRTVARALARFKKKA